MTTDAIEKCLSAILQRIAPEIALEEFPVSDFFSLYSSLGWRLRHLTQAISSDEHALMKEAGLAAPEIFSMTDLARISLLRRVLDRLAKEEQPGFVEALFRKGDNQEREALLKGLKLLPLPGQFLATAVDSCRAAVQSTFEAIACDNTYPAEYFPPEAFRSMVLKALHLGVPVRRIYGLERRMDNDLSKMAADYASELKAAGRLVPADVIVILDFRNKGVAA